jgi:hypothetical protein
VAKRALLRIGLRLGVAVVLAALLGAVAGPAVAAPARDGATPSAASAWVRVYTSDSQYGSSSPAWTSALTSLSVVTEGTVNEARGETTISYDWGDGTTTTQTMNPCTGTCSYGGGFYNNHTFSLPGTYTIATTITNLAGSWTDTVAYQTAGTDLVPVAPTRVLDTRDGTGQDEAHRLPAHGQLTLGMTGLAGIPADGVSAVVANVTVTGTTAAGYLSVGPSNVVSPTWSNLNYTAGQTVANLATVQLGPANTLLFTNGSPQPVDVIADLVGYYRAAPASSYLSIPPTRALDTRTSHAAAPRATIPVQVAGAHGIPASGVTAVAVNLTATAATAAGFVTAYPGGQPLPTTSSLNYRAGQTVANLAIVPVGADGTIDLYNGSSGSTQLIADLDGYYTDDGTGYHFVALAPHRAYDTRDPDAGTFGHPLGPNSADSPSGWLAVGIWPYAFVLNVTATAPTAAGFFATYPYGSPRPNASNLNFTAGQTVPNLVQVQGNSGSYINVYNGSSGTTHLIIDTMGCFD